MGVAMSMPTIKVAATIRITNAMIYAAMAELYDSARLDFQEIEIDKRLVRQMLLAALARSRVRGTAQGDRQALSNLERWQGPRRE